MFFELRLCRVVLLFALRLVFVFLAAAVLLLQGVVTALPRLLRRFLLRLYSLTDLFCQLRRRIQLLSKH